VTGALVSANAWGEVVQLLRLAAQQEIMPRFRRLTADQVRTKSGPTDLVTEADEGAERLISAGLERLFPECVVIGEEATAANPALLDRLSGAELAFVVDPIDGTSNYCAGLPLFGCMAAAVVRGVVVASAILDPVCEDTAVALRGEGAWLEAPDGSRTPLRVAEPATPERMTGCISWRYMSESLRGAVTRNMVKLAGVSDYRCAAHEYRMLAGGHCDYLVFNRMMPWDHLPGWLLHQEAGGYSAHFDGSPYRPHDRTGGLVCTADRASFEALCGTLLGPV